MSVTVAGGSLLPFPHGGKGGGIGGFWVACGLHYFSAHRLSVAAPVAPAKDANATTKAVLLRR